MVISFFYVIIKYKLFIYILLLLNLNFMFIIINKFINLANKYFMYYLIIINF